MLPRFNAVLSSVQSLAAIRGRGEQLLPHEEELYKELSSYAITLVRFENVCSQAALLKAERDLDGFQERDGASPLATPSAT
jgi:hypothetical protein